MQSQNKVSRFIGNLIIGVVHCLKSVATEAMVEVIDKHVREKKQTRFTRKRKYENKGHSVRWRAKNKPFPCVSHQILEISPQGNEKRKL